MKPVVHARVSCGWILEGAKRRLSQLEIQACGGPARLSTAGPATAIALPQANVQRSEPGDLV